MVRYYRDRISFMNFKNFITVHDFFMFFYLFPLRKLAAVMPPKVIHLISIPLVYIYSLLPVSQKRRNAITKTMNLISNNEKTQKDIEKLSRQSLRNFVHTCIEDLTLNNLNKRDLLKRGVVQGLEHLKNALSDKKGVILVGGHFSGDRISKLFLREIGFPIMCVRTKSLYDPSASLIARKYFSPVMTNAVNEALEDYVFIQDKGFGMEILKRLRNNGIVSILFDVKGKETVQGLHCPFLGSQRFFPTNFLQIAHLAGAAVVPMLCIGNSASFTITFGERIEFQKFADKEKFISTNLNTLVRILESQILQYPAHWLLTE
jgi:lauroyl/myristoyl acyltransferase